MIVNRLFPPLGFNLIPASVRHSLNRQISRSQACQAGLSYMTQAAC